MFARFLFAMNWRATAGRPYGLCKIFNIVSTANRKTKSAPSTRELLSEAKLRELKRVFQIIKTPPVIFFCGKMTAPSKMGRKHNSNLITTGSRHIFTNFLGGSKPPPYSIGYIIHSVRSTHFFSLFILHFRLVNSPLHSRHTHPTASRQRSIRILT